MANRLRILPAGKGEWHVKFYNDKGWKPVVIRSLGFATKYFYVDVQCATCRKRYAASSTIWRLRHKRECGMNVDKKST